MKKVKSFRSIGLGVFGNFHQIKVSPSNYVIASRKKRFVGKRIRNDFSLEKFIDYKTKKILMYSPQVFPRRPMIHIIPPDDKTGGRK